LWLTLPGLFAAASLADNATAPGQVEEQLEFARQCWIQGKNVILPEETSSPQKKKKR